jgi:hypothetical protein
VQFGHAIGLRALEAHHHHRIAVQFIGLEGGMHFFLVMKDAGRRFDHMAFRGDGGGFDYRAAEFAIQHTQAAGWLERVFDAAQNGFVAAGLRCRYPMHLAGGIQPWLGGVSLKPGAEDRLHIRMQQAAGEQFADQESHAAGGVEVIHIRRAVRIDMGQQRGDFGEIREIIPVQDNARRRRHDDEMQGMVGGTAGGVQADNGVGEGFFVQHAADGREFIAGRGDRHGALGGRMGQRIPQLGIGVDEGSTRQMQAHDFHHHLIGVGGAVKRAGAGGVVGFGLRFQQFGAADLALRVELAHLGFFRIGHA